MALFSERYGYVKPRDVMERESLSEEIRNAICSSYDMLEQALDIIDVNDRSGYDVTYSALEMTVWSDFQNKRRNDFYLNGVDIPADSRPPIPVILGHLV